MGVDSFFNFRNVAVIGAAREKFKVGNAIFANLLKNKLIKAFPVNPSADAILGQKCYKDVLEIPFTVDMAIIAVKAEFVVGVMKQVAKKNIKNVIILSAGFSEIGNSELEREVKEVAEASKIQVLGPNCFGFVDTSRGINTTFFEGIPEKGEIAFISQSGALGVGVLDIALNDKIGLSGFVSLGNSMMLDFSDFIEHYSKDKNTKVIALYMEGLKAGRGTRFLEACKKCKKPIFVLKSGKTESGENAARSHTASLASERGVYESVFRQAGITEVNSISELLLASRLKARYERLGKRVCIVTNAGGLGVLASDVCSENGIEVTSLPEQIVKKLNLLLPGGWSRNNPIDLVGDALVGRYRDVLVLLDKESWFDFFVVLLTPQYMTQTNETAHLVGEIKKPVFTCFYGGEKVRGAKILLRESGIENFEDVSEFSVLGKVAV